MSCTTRQGQGENLHDHPAIGVYHAGPNSGYGLTLAQLPLWTLSPLPFMTTGGGRLSSTVVEAGAFLHVMPGEGKPDVQVHMIPAMLGWQGKPMVWGSGYYADVCVSRPASRGTLRLESKDPRAAPLIDLGVLTDDRDMDVLVAGFKRLRKMLAEAPFGDRRVHEAFPGEIVESDEQIREHVRARAGTCYHPVGTIRMGGYDAPVDFDHKLRGSENVWVVDTSVMPSITSANTNAPAMMIGRRAVDKVRTSKIDR